MKRLMLLSTLIFIAASLAFSAVYDRKLARDTEPGGIYFIAPDVSDDSLTQTHVYYSPDTGHTFTIIKT